MREPSLRIIFGAALVKAVVVTAAVCLFGCVKPLPPVPTPGDEFSGATIDCETVSRDDRGSACAPVDACLADSADVDVASACLTGLRWHYSMDALACVVRDRGAVAWAAVRTRDLAETDRESRIATMSGAWISAHNLGYR